MQRHIIEPSEDRETVMIQETLQRHIVETRVESDNHNVNDTNMKN